MSIKIDKGVPLPPSSAGRPLGELRITLRSMDVGDSFFLSRQRQYVSVRLVEIRRTEMKDRVFTARTVEENGVKGTRVWRVS